MAEPSPVGDVASARRRADAMVGLLVAAVVAVIAAVAVLATSGSAAFAVGLIVAALLFGTLAVVLLRSITPDERARLTASSPRGAGDDEPDDGPDDRPQAGPAAEPEAGATDDQAPGGPR